MRFRFNVDHGHHIVGWVVPDNPLATSRVYVSIEGRRVAEIPATIVAKEVVRLGWHSTGLCTFLVNRKLVPKLDQLPSLEIYDLDTNVLVYRRLPSDGFVQEKVLLINTSILPETALQMALFPHFQHCHFGIGSFSEELLVSLFNMETLRSCLLSGAMFPFRYEPNFANSNTHTMLLLHDPFIEMAQRLYWARERAAVAQDPQQVWRFGEFLEAALFVNDHDLTDIKSLKRLFRAMPEAAFHLLYNPLTRQLSAHGPQERIRASNSIVAVEVLSRIAIVGHREHFEAFATTIFDRFGIDAPIPQPQPIPDDILALAEKLRTIKIVQELLRFDLVISDAVRQSVAKNWAE